MRRFALLIVVTVVAVACVDAGSDEASRSPLPTAPSPVVSSPSAAQEVDEDVFETRWPIKHVVFLIKENRTFDHLFGRFPGARGVTVGMDDGVERPLVRGTDGATDADVPHCYDCALLAWNGGKMDGFAIRQADLRPQEPVATASRRFLMGRACQPWRR